MLYILLCKSWSWIDWAQKGIWCIETVLWCIEWNRHLHLKWHPFIFYSYVCFLNWGCSTCFLSISVLISHPRSLSLSLYLFYNICVSWLQSEAPVCQHHSLSEKPKDGVFNLVSNNGCTLPELPWCWETLPTRSSITFSPWSIQTSWQHWDPCALTWRSTGKNRLGWRSLFCLLLST